MFDGLGLSSTGTGCIMDSSFIGDLLLLLGRIFLFDQSRPMTSRAGALLALAYSAIAVRSSRNPQFSARWSDGDGLHH